MSGRKQAAPVFVGRPVLVKEGQASGSDGVFAFGLGHEVGAGGVQPRLGQRALGVLAVLQGTQPDAEVPLDLPDGPQPPLVLGFDQGPE